MSAIRPDSPDLTPELVWAALTAEERGVVESWLDELSIHRAGWPAVPPLWEILTSVVVERLALDMPELSRSDARAAAAEALGMPDDPALSTRPSDRFGRTVRRHRRRAGQFDRTRDSEAA